MKCRTSKQVGATHSGQYLGVQLPLGILKKILIVNFIDFYNIINPILKPSLLLVVSFDFENIKMNLLKSLSSYGPEFSIKKKILPLLLALHKNYF